VAASSLPTIACGYRFDISFERLDSAVYNLQDMMGRDPELVQKMKEVVPELNPVSVDELALIRKLGTPRSSTSTVGHYIAQESSWTALQS
jgi:hypothetical protein